MGALGAVGGVGGLGSSYGDSGGGSDDAGIESDAAAASVDSSQGWYDANAVMNTSGDVDGGTVQLDDSDVSSQYVLGDQKQQPLQPAMANQQPDVPVGGGFSPTSDVVNQVAAVYAANSISSSGGMW
jgi:hypothetical protein